MDRTALKNYAPKARRDFIEAVTERAAAFGLTKEYTEPVKVEGDVAIIGGMAHPKVVAEQRTTLETRIEREGFEQVMEAVAYTWFNRFVAIRYMELHGYLDHGYRVLSNPDPAEMTPEILEHAQHVELPGLDKEKVVELKLEGTKEEELYRHLLIAQCNALHRAMPFLFEQVRDETELLLPGNLLHSDSLIRQLVSEIPEEGWQDVEVIGWIYQFYISEKKDEVIGKVVKSEDIPAATQLFTPNWIVKYLVQNSIGRQWLGTYPDSPLKGQMDYYIEPAEQTEEVQQQLDEITPDSLNPEAMTLLDPACGSGHILVEAYDLFKAIYLERGYRAREIPGRILRNNLFGLEIDERATQLAGFALLMKARADDRRLLEGDIHVNVHCIRSSDGLDPEAVYNILVHANGDAEDDTPPTGEFEFMEEVHSPLMAEAKKDRAAVAEGAEELPGAGFTVDDIRVLLDLFKGDKAKTFGSLIRIPEGLAAKLPEMVERADRVAHDGDFYRRRVAEQFLPIAEQGQVLGQQYDAVVANPPYMGTSYFNPRLKTYVGSEHPDFSGDLYAAFTGRGLELLAPHARLSFITNPTWQFLPMFEDMRRQLLHNYTIESLVDNGRGIFGSDFGSCAFIIRSLQSPAYQAQYHGLSVGQGKISSIDALASRFRAHSPIQRSSNDFLHVPGTPVSCYVPKPVLDVFATCASLTDYAAVRQGIKTGDIDRFLRYWHEVPWDSIYFDCQSHIESAADDRRWYPCNKGGDFRKWFGNLEFVLDWQNDGDRIRNFKDENGKLRSRPQNLEYFFRPGISWSTVTTMGRVAFRLSPPGRIFESAGSTIFPNDHSDLTFLLGVLSSRLASISLQILSPKVSLGEGAIGRIPVPSLRHEDRERLVDAAQINLDIHSAEWAEFETSYGFARLRLLNKSHSTIADSIQQVMIQWQERCEQVIHSEERIDEILDAALGLPSDYVTSTESRITTLSTPAIEGECKSAMSYAIGCLMGRYSLDKPGLIYAHSGNEGFDPSRYQTFPADGDGIVPITDFEWFEDDVANRVIQFIAMAWPKEHLEENLDFVADSLTRKRGESSRDTIRRYLSQQFFKDHLQTYKNRPIYWLFSSGKERAFQALVYLHRYNEGTLARMRTEYVIPLQSRLAGQLDHLEGEISGAGSTSQRKQAEKQRDKLLKQQEELRRFDEKLKHYADQRIALDLDDGVKVNYGKFGDLLAEVKKVTGKKQSEA